ncbi:L,D-transpeptidase family protein [Rivularia sp. UHCC 0363]|uniref:L,D-transpeptidase family protein n=1 Tax=Rivularia sp. UHCC 0363 TaxID=3110244 RepID=UPI002B211F63|nr:peptidoglycan-binding protein [Rivularia sp. UHCC 0363]MEA5597310.1 peptidoglycan-binding protein [Rivularia sp. UHCC 0363]
MAETYISKVNVDLWKQEVTLVWTGSDAAAQQKGPFHCTPGAGISGVNCDDVATSKRSGTDCTPKGEFSVIGHDRFFSKYPEAEWVTRFQDPSRGIALHYYPTVPEFPSSHGCVRIANKEAAKRIYDNTKVGKSIVSVNGELRPNFNNTLKRGVKSQDVRKVQLQLINKGYQLSADSDFGAKTEAAVKQFQKDKGLVSDGICGRQTYTALFA